MRLLLPAVLVLVGSAAEARAGKIMLITRGDTISPLGSPTLPDGKEVKVDNIKVGYKYSYAGIFWVDFWTWGGEYCLYKNLGDKEYFGITPDVAAQMLNTTPDKLSKPFWYRVPAGLLVLASLVPLGVLLKMLGGRADRRANALLARPEYATALAAVLDTSKGGTKNERFEAAVQTLVYAGENEATARRNLDFLLNRHKTDA